MIIGLIIIAVIWFALMGNRTTSTGLRTSSFSSPTGNAISPIGPRTPISPVQQILSLFGKPINQLAPVPRRQPVNGATPMLMPPKSSGGGGPMLSGGGGGAPGGGGGAPSALGGFAGLTCSQKAAQDAAAAAALFTNRSTGGCTCNPMTCLTSMGLLPVSGYTASPLPSLNIAPALCSTPVSCVALTCTLPLCSGFAPPSLVSAPIPAFCSGGCAPAPAYCTTGCCQWPPLGSCFCCYGSCRFTTCTVGSGFGY
jgi:hypothetical protein